MRTRVSDAGTFVWAVSDDYPVTEGEMRLAMLRLSNLIRVALIAPGPRRRA